MRLSYERIGGFFAKVSFESCGQAIICCFHANLVEMVAICEAILVLHERHRTTPQWQHALRF